ncbi:MAG: coenzyme F420-0:L-glutamate ligase [Nitrosopumilus sp. H13]|nr:MAG: coenzyme F420-0:L-glutamate ligase [Nitrosopumilus sp. H13]
MQVIPVHMPHEITPSDDMPEIVASCGVSDGDILVVAQKAVSKQEGRIVRLDSIRPSPLAEGIASQYGKDPRIMHLILAESRRIIRMGRGIIIVETNSGLVCANAGIDESNMEAGYAALLPKDPDASALAMSLKIKEITGNSIPVIISDTFGRPFRMGQTDCAIGVCGLDPILDYAGKRDSFGRNLRVTEIAIADELCAAAELVMGKSLGNPAAIIRGYEFDPGNGTSARLLRPEPEDLFRN